MGGLRGEGAQTTILFLTGGERGGRALIKTKHSLQKILSFENKVSILKGFRVKPSTIERRLLWNFLLK
jgi:hypothetical protein